MRALLPIGAAARRLGLSVDTVRALVQTGELEDIRTSGGHRRFDPAVLDAHMARRSGRRARRSQDFHERRPEAEWQEPQAREPRALRPLATEPPKPPLEESTNSLTRIVDRVVENARLDELKSYGRSLIPYDATAGARSAVIETLASYVNASRYPATTPSWEARQAIEAKVAAVLEPFNAEAARAAEMKAAKEARRAVRVRDERRLDSLIERGKWHAFMKTVAWDVDDAEEARADVLEALEDHVEPNWTEREVIELVDEVLDEVLKEWNEESDD
jgi:excisionase family DNA binding protein